MTSDNDDSDTFLQEMEGVEPLKVEKKVPIKRQGDSSLTIQARRDAATALIEKDCNHLSVGHVELLDAYYPLSFKQAGVQNGVFRKLKQGKYPQDARLDLHRMTVDQARKEVFGFIKDCLSYDLRILIIVHGKGSHSGAESALLKSYVNKWLPQMSEVQAFCSAQPQHGGVGAVYILLAKSERKKKENRDHFSRGRTVMGD
ncbi:MAG: DNA endonuclease SmrA [Spongiibacteraceae bacterium]|nr:DNA endonuclease SmrA [Spongiibacteraceae bacterium]